MDQQRRGTRITFCIFFFYKWVKEKLQFSSKVHEHMWLQHITFLTMKPGSIPLIGGRFVSLPVCSLCVLIAWQPVCLFVYTLSRSKQMASLFFCLFTPSPSRWIGVSTLKGPVELTFSKNCMRRVVMSQHSILRSAAHCEKKLHCLCCWVDSWMMLFWEHGG